MTVLNRASLSLAILFAAVTSGAAQRKTLDAEYREVAGKLLGAALVDQEGWDKLSYLTTRIGNRLSGSANLERAVQWASQQMKTGHIDSWDVGQGAHDDGGGIVAAWQAVTLMRGLQTTGEHYFDWHHTNSDTLDKVNPQDLRKCIATLAVMAYILADMPEPLK
jgi:hypothetical protein